MWVLEYSKGTWQAHSKGDVVDIKGLTTRSTEHVRSLIDNMLSVWSWREDSVLREKRYYADPSECGFCEYKDMCVPNDPFQKTELKLRAN